MTTCVCARAHVCGFVSMSECLWIREDVWLCLHRCTSVRVSTSVSGCTDLCVWMCMCLCVCVKLRGVLNLGAPSPIWSMTVQYYLDLIPGSGRSPREGNGNSLQYSCLENPMARGVWWAIVHRVTKSWTQLKWLNTHTRTHTHTHTHTQGTWWAIIHSVWIYCVGGNSG